MRKAAIYAGTFDPITLGHMDLIQRAASIFDRLIVAVAESTRKAPLFTLQERMDLARRVVANTANVEVDSFDGLLVDYAQAKGIKVLVRGLRAFSDFEFEFQMALTNRKMAPDIETIFLMPKEEYSYLSSSSVREIAELGGKTASFVPAPIEAALKKKQGARSATT
ncbi:MAG: pantetheine-phosphate adenylyltransferase [Kiritimatiellae bacterium]|nr:pantetheine-phosphate adenylyltransferase [Kiritimatiellia bacterium]